MKRGFTLIEIMTAVTIFLIVMTMSMGAILSVFNANKKSESLKTVMDNLNLAMESMSREMRFGQNYHCESDPSGSGAYASPVSCPAGGELVSFLANDGTQTVYRINNHRIERSTDGGTTYIAVTAPEISIGGSTSNPSFYVTGAEVGDSHQPRVLIKIQGTAGSTTTVQTTFSIETMVSQRLLDN